MRKLANKLHAIGHKFDLFRHALQMTPEFEQKLKNQPAPNIPKKEEDTGEADEPDESKYCGKGTEYQKFLDRMKAKGYTITKESVQGGYAARFKIQPDTTVSAICHGGSYGGQSGQIEMAAWEGARKHPWIYLSEYDEVAGHLTAGEAEALVQKLESGWKGYPPRHHMD